MSALATTDFISTCPVMSIAMRMTWHNTLRLIHSIRRRCCDLRRCQCRLVL